MNEPSPAEIEEALRVVRCNGPMGHGISRALEPHSAKWFKCSECGTYFAAETVLARARTGGGTTDGLYSTTEDEEGRL